MWLWNGEGARYEADREEGKPQERGRFESWKGFMRCANAEMASLEFERRQPLLQPTALVKSSEDDEKVCDRPSVKDRRRESDGTLLPGIIPKESNIKDVEDNLRPCTRRCRPLMATNHKGWSTKRLLQSMLRDLCGSQSMRERKRKFGGRR